MQLKSQKNHEFDLIKTKLSKIIALELDILGEELELENSLESYGLDSLRVAKIIAEVDRNFGVKLSFEAFEECENIENLAKFVCTKLDVNFPQESKLLFTSHNLTSQVSQSTSSKNENRRDSWNVLGLVNQQLIKPVHQGILKYYNPHTAPKIVGIASNFPADYYSQQELKKIFSENLTSESISIDHQEVNRFFTNVTLKGRHFALSPLDDLGSEEALDKGIEAAEALAATAINNLLKSKGLKPENISMVVESSLLPATPSIFARVMSRSSFPSSTKRMSLYGVGCMNGVHGLSKIKDYIEGHPTEAVILISVELASVLWQGSFQKDLRQYLAKYSENPEQYTSSIKMTFITAALFGDGAVALLVVGSEHPLYKESQRMLPPQIIDTRSNLVPDTSDLIGVDILLKNSSFRAIVKPEVPDLLPDAIAQTIEPLLEKNNLSLKDISHWILHPGGPKIVRAIEERFELNSQALSLSWSTLKEKGNLSSAHVLYMLEQLLASSKAPKKGELGLMIAMGPGLSQEAILLKF